MTNKGMARRVLLVSMPFASIRYPSPALSILKPLVEREGFSCDIAYLNIVFQAYTGRPDIYEMIADLMVVGEWVFGAELFGEEGAESQEERLEALDIPLLPDGLKPEAVLDSLGRLHSIAGPFIERCVDGMNWGNYSVIGFTSVCSQNVASLALARHIKERWPEKIIAFGGANCEEDMGRALLRLFPFVDWVFNGEGDLSFPQAITQWFAGRPPEGIPGVAYRHDDQIFEQTPCPSPHIDSLPYPDFDDYFMALEKWAPTYFPLAPVSLEFSRGCWWGRKSQCVFCGLNSRRLDFRSKSAERAKDEIKAARERYKVDKVILTDSILDMRFFKTLLPTLAEYGGLQELFLDTKANLNREQVRMLRSAGVRLFQPGIESLDTEILAYMRKGTTLLQNVQFLKWAREYGLRPAWNLLYGFPGENPKAYGRMASLIPSIVHLCPPTMVSPVLLVRFSPLFEQSQKWGLRNVRAHVAYQSVYPFDEEDLNELAYFFDYDFDGKDSIPDYVTPVKEQVRMWKKCWGQREPPVLSFARGPGAKVTVHDSRPCRLSQRVDLEGDIAIAYSACDARRHFDSLAKQVGEQSGKAYAGDSALRASLDELVAQRLMLREGDQYLSLATRLPV